MATPSPGQENKPSISQNPLVILLGAILVFVVLLELFFIPAPARELPYSEFKQLVLKRRMADLKISTDTIVGSLLGTPSTTSRTPTFGPFDAAGTATVLFFLSVCSVVATPHCVNYRASSPLILLSVSLRHPRTECHAKLAFEF